jgi:hypothetical protein
MTTLRDIQQSFKAAMAESARDWKAAELGIQERPPLSTKTRVEIYHYAYLARIAESIQEDYEPLMQWIDEAGWNEIVRAYLQVYPSTYRTLAEVSRHFPEFLDSILQPGDPKFLPDLARLEWAKTCSRVTHTTADANVLPLAGLADQNLSQVELCLNPSLHLLTSEWPVDKLRRRGDTVAFRELVRLAIYRGPSGLIVERLRSRQWELLARMEAGETLEQILVWMSDRRITAVQTQNWFARWSARGIIQGFRVNASNCPT